MEPIIAIVAFILIWSLPQSKSSQSTGAKFGESYEKLLKETCGCDQDKKKD